MRAYERFLEYVKYPTMSDEASETTPSSAKQLKLGRFLTEELIALGLEAEMDEFGYVYGRLPANCEGEVSLDFSVIKTEAFPKILVIYYFGNHKYISLNQLVFIFIHVRIFRHKYI